MSLERISQIPEDQSAIVHGAGARKIFAMATQEVHTVLNSISSTNSATSASAAAKAYHGKCDSCSDRNSSDAGIQLSAATQRSGQAAVCAQPNHIAAFPRMAIRESDAHVQHTSFARNKVTSQCRGGSYLPTYLRDVT